VDGADNLPEELTCYFGEQRFTLPTNEEEVESCLNAYSATPTAVGTEPDQAMYIAFTSGSTGQPKAILGSHRPISHFVTWQQETFGIDSRDRFALLSGLAHDPLLRDIFAPLTVGASLHIPEEDDIAPKQLAQWVETEGITMTHLTPQMGQILVTDVMGENHLLRTLFFGGDRLGQALVRSIQNLAPSATLVNFYGATETPQAMGYARVDGDESRQMVPIGVGIEGVQLLILNRQGELEKIQRTDSTKPETWVVISLMARWPLRDGWTTK